MEDVCILKPLICTGSHHSIMVPPSKEDLEIAKEMENIVLERAGLLTKPDSSTWDGKELFRFRRNLFAIPIKYAALSLYQSCITDKGIHKQAQLCGVSPDRYIRSIWCWVPGSRAETDCTVQAIQGNLYGHQTPSMTCKNT